MLPIAVRSYPNEWAQIDSGSGSTNRANILTIGRGWTTCRDFEVFSSDPLRVSRYIGSYPKEIRRGEGFSARAPGTKLINLVVHDTAQGVSVRSDAPNSDLETSASSLVVTASSSNSPLMPADRITLGGTGNSRWISLNPAANQFGAATISVRVSDGSLTTSTSFGLTVNALNDYPSVSIISPQTTYGGKTLGPIPFTISDPGTPADQLRATPRSSNTTILPTSGLVVGGSGANRTIPAAPAPNQFGTLKIYLDVTDGSKTVEKSSYFTSAP